MAFAKFFDDIALCLRRDRSLRGCGRGGDDVHGHERYLLPQLGEICTSHSSSAQYLIGFQFPALAVQKIIENVSPFLANSQF